MSVAPIISPESARSANTAARPKRITPPAHWQNAAPAAAPKKAPAKIALPSVIPAVTAPVAPAAFSRRAFVAVLLLGVIALNLLLLWLFPLPALQAPRNVQPAFSPAPVAEDSELPVWLRP